MRLSLADPAFLAGFDDPLVRKPNRLARLLARTHEQLGAGGAAEEALWSLWVGTSWPRRLRAQVDRGSGSARSAHRDLDAICALFEVAARGEEKQDHRGALVFLDEVEAQQIPADTLAERGVRGESVRLLTAHRSKGLEWRMVVVAGVQEGGWPDLRRRGSLLQTDRLGCDGLVEPLGSAAMLAEERRLFYVAVTRARERLVVTAVASAEADGDQPSRLLDDLGLPVVSRHGRPPRLMSLPGLVAELRRVASDVHASSAMRRSAAARLAALAAETVGGQPMAPSADPAGWWGLRERTNSPTPVRPDDLPLHLSASGLSSILDCPLRWFLAREAAGESARTSSLGFGSVIHALADHMGRDTAVDARQLRLLLDSIWDQLDFDSPWIAARERVEADKAIDRFVKWHEGRDGRTYVASEVPFRVDVGLEESETVTLSGKVDRVERDSEGRLVVVDLKTSKKAPTAAAVAVDPQLGLYQLVVANGALAKACGDVGVSGGAELVQLRLDGAGGPKIQVQAPQAPDDDGRKPVEVQLSTAAQVIRSERFDATVNGHCAMCDFAQMCPTRRRAGTVV
ncbi:MAG: ATP-dependent helicase [Propionibacteriales bacterium]|nr:ATP-dependent helicase [Propionibacteriales bacterium]